MPQASIRECTQEELRMSPGSVRSIRELGRAIGQERRGCARQQPDHGADVEGC